MHLIKDPHDIACQIAKDYETSSSMSEADTRHQIIDTILHDVLSWPRALVVCESYIDPGFADYVLTGRKDSLLLFIEAKKEGIYFSIPARFDNNGQRSQVKVKSLLTDTNICKAILQVQNYCISRGCEYAAITNGHQWIIFKTFERNHDWRNLNALVIQSLSYFCDSFTDAINFLGYTAITENASLIKFFGGLHQLKRNKYYPKAKVPEYNNDVHQNYLATSLRPLADRYLGKMNPFDTEFMDKCYVRIRDYHASVTGVTQIINDKLTPYFKNYNVQEFFDDSYGGEFGKRISSNLRERRTSEVIILFGGKGAGKTTFIRKILHHRPSNEIINYSVVCIVDLIECPEDKVQIDNTISTQLLAELDKDNLLSAERDSLISLFDSLISLFNDRYSIAEKQILAGLKKTGEAYNLQLNQLLKEWMDDWEYCAARIADYWKTKRKGVIVVIDNTDQYSTEIQDYCFTVAQHIASIVDGLVVISMREERFHESRLHGTLDAFQNNGFHLSSPPSQFVFDRRLVYMLEVLDDKEMALNISPTLNDERINEVKKLFRILLSEFRRRGSNLSQFLRACSHGNMRLALDMFRWFLLSGYTKIEEMLLAGNWNLQVHQVLRPMMIPDRFFYNEGLSNIPNLFQVRSDSLGSHFTSLRILSLLSENMSPINPVLVPVSRLNGIFTSKYNMVDDLTKNLDMMLRKGIIESNNRLDQYSENVDSIKITPYGYYLKDVLSNMFSYLDLVCIDCAIHDESVANSLATMASEEFELFFSGKKGERIELRLRRVQEFITYLKREMEHEIELFSLTADNINYAYFIDVNFKQERKLVMSSAKRYVCKSQ